MGEAAVLYWVVQRDAETGAPITSKSFVDYADAERHQGELEDLGDPEQILEVTIEALPIKALPK